MEVPKKPASRAPKTRNPRSEIVNLGKNNAGRRTITYRPLSANYPCPKCSQKLYADEIIDFGTVNGKTGKHHRECPK
jgi:hypothetical protein